MTFSEKIKELRKNSGLSRKEVAEKLGIPYTTYSNYENGYRLPKYDTLWKIISFFYGTESMEPNIDLQYLYYFAWKREHPDSDELECAETDYWIKKNERDPLFLNIAIVFDALNFEGRALVSDFIDLLALRDEFKKNKKDSSPPPEEK